MFDKTSEIYVFHSDSYHSKQKIIHYQSHNVVETCINSYSFLKIHNPSRNRNNTYSIKSHTI